MRLKTMCLLLVVCLAVTGLTGCRRAPATDAVKNIQSVELLGITGFGTENATVLRTWTEPDDIKLIVNAIGTSSKIDGILDVVQPEYAIRIHHKRGDPTVYMLWVNFWDGNYSGMIMDIRNTHTGYTLRADYAQLLFDMIRGN
jgi:hypothetical protein